MSSYADIKKTVKMNRAASVNGYKNGGATSAKKSGTTVNIVVPSMGGDGAKVPPIAPVGADMARSPSPMPSPPPAPMPPVAPQSAGQAGLAALGSPPLMAKGGKVKAAPAKMANGGKVEMKAGSGSALGRLEKAKHCKV